MPNESRFDPRKHLIQLKGKLYLETKYRIQWFREDHPRGCISTEIVSYDPMMIKATVFDGEGTVLATAHAGAVDKGNAVWSGRALEKSETAAIGRALAHAGYGTQFAGTEDREDTRRSSEPSAERKTSTGPTPPPRTPASAGSGEPATASKPHWLERDDAAAAFNRRLKAIHPALDLAGAQRLLDKPLTSFSTSDNALAAIRQAHQQRLAEDPA